VCRTALPAILEVQLGRLVLSVQLWCGWSLGLNWTTGLAATIGSYTWTSALFDFLANQRSLKVSTARLYQHGRFLRQSIRCQTCQGSRPVCSFNACTNNNGSNHTSFHTECLSADFSRSYSELQHNYMYIMCVQPGRIFCGILTLWVCESCSHFAANTRLFAGFAGSSRRVCSGET
jgi:hypothetical protein